jgi:hypothetical protein
MKKGSVLTILATVLIAWFIITINTGCSGDSDEPNSSPVDTTKTFNPGAQDDDDKTLNTPPATTARYPDVSGHGILWKPVSDSTGKVEVLLNPSYGRPSVKIKARNNQTIAVGSFTYYSNPNRATYRFNISGPTIAKKYGTVYLIVGSKIFEVPNPARRYE